jgi:hypothetical protein
MNEIHLEINVDQPDFAKTIKGWRSERKTFLVRVNRNSSKYGPATRCATAYLDGQAPTSRLWFFIDSLRVMTLMTEFGLAQADEYQVRWLDTTDAAMFTFEWSPVK